MINITGDKGGCFVYSNNNANDTIFLYRDIIYLLLFWEEIVCCFQLS